MIIFASSALFVYFIIKAYPELYEKYYFFVHILAISGIMCYIKSYEEYTSTLGNIT
jgi:hypothetical protein